MQQLVMQLCASCSSWYYNSALHAAVCTASLRFMQQLVLQLCASCSSLYCISALHAASGYCNSALHAAVGTTTLHFLQQLGLKICASCSNWHCNSVLLVAVGAATLRLMRQLALLLCASCDSWGCNCALHVAVCSAPRVAIRGWNSALLAAVGTELCASCSSLHGAATLLFMRKLALQLCATCDSWGCNSCQIIPRCTTSAVRRAQLCATCSSWGCNSALPATLCVATLCFLQQWGLNSSLHPAVGAAALRFKGSCQLSTRLLGQFWTFLLQQPSATSYSFGCNFAFGRSQQVLSEVARTNTWESLYTRKPESHSWGNREVI